jgi:hypothetical protein
VQESLDTVAEVKAQTTKDGWLVRCNYDQFKAERECFAGKFGDTRGHGEASVKIAFLNGEGPTIQIPFNDYPGATATIRVDDGPVLPITESAALVKSFGSGRTAYVAFYNWPDGERKLTIDLAGFSEAYSQLLSIKEI